MSTPLVTLNTSKPGDVKKLLSLDLEKDEVFIVEGAWADGTDIDLHALITLGTAQEAPTLTEMEQICSTYNVIRPGKNEGKAVLERQPDGTFSIYNGALVHSPDVTDGTKADLDEFIRISPALLPKVPGQVIEIPIIIMIHPQNKGLTFSQIKDPMIRIKNSTGKVLLEANLSSQFGQFVGAHMGSITVDPAGKVEYISEGACSGFNGDFMSVINHFAGQ